ncbi:MotA/TolQ/ExbB proton channel family protein [Caldanaerobacter subterraneus]|uniref:MotA/TolQ/ExbB proton channel family protein n=1 Tax=Caldanaerobacter subterraneus TaxID=911092 RepID=A0A7Y2PL89_9THEO|nr:MotA/TolQ/ExbB proton channel family protein [Caldanaerobacter subterraneus]NNG66460.1 MotA/TolQ/ExbB proton channel family protein [Caldanaerobacter subterraneus]
MNNSLIHILHSISQGLLIPVIITLYLFLAISLVELGSFLIEIFHKRKISAKKMLEALRQKKDTAQTLQAFISDGKLPQRAKRILITYLDANTQASNREILRKKLIETEEIKAAKVLEPTDIIAKLGPLVGLMGTLIPLGPGLTALANGDIKLLAQSISVAFDNTLIGMASAGICYFISRVRRRWYQEYILVLEDLLEIAGEVKQTEKSAV